MHEEVVLKLEKTCLDLQARLNEALIHELKAKEDSE